MARVTLQRRPTHRELARHDAQGVARRERGIDAGHGFMITKSALGHRSFSF